METKKVSVNMGDVVREKNVSKAIAGLKLRDAYLNQQGELVMVFLDAERHAHTVHLMPAEVIFNSGEVEFKPNEINVEAIIEEE